MKFNTIDANTNTFPVKNVFCVPILPNFNINMFINKKQILCIIPSNSIQLRPSDYWYDVEYNGLLNTYPIAICVFYNEFAYETSSINVSKFSNLEYVINKNLANNITLQLNKDILPIRKKKKQFIKTHLIPIKRLSTLTHPFVWWVTNPNQESVYGSDAKMTKIYPNNCYTNIKMTLTTVS